MDSFPRNPKLNSGWPRLPEMIRPDEIKFLGEQEGKAEDQFKVNMSRLFANQPGIFRRAYLARVSYGEPSICSVLLCLRNIESIEHELQRGFKYMFSEICRVGDFYDSIMLNEEQEQELRKVCKPFYEAP